jgi:hypothetical protein
MKSAPNISLAAMEEATQFAPLVAIGSYIRTVDLLSPVYSRLRFLHSTHTEKPVEALIDLWVSIMAGCRSVRQINSKTRPDLTLALSWGRKQFAEQSTVARVLDSCRAEQVAQFRAAGESMFNWLGQTPRHDWSRPLTIDIDLTGLPAGRQAIGSTKGYFQKKGGVVANCVASVPQRMMKQWAHGYIQVIR